MNNDAHHEGAMTTKLTKNPFSNVVSFVFFGLREAIRFGVTSVCTRY
jgi:hypothetical protein